MADESMADGAPPGGEKADPATVFAALAEIIYQGSDASQMYAAICVAATLAIRGTSPCGTGSGAHSTRPSSTPPG